jgi:hypothetical protein
MLQDAIMLQDAVYMYYGEMDHCSLSLACQVGLHPSTLAHLTTISSNVVKVVVIGLTKIIWGSFTK